MNLCRGSKMDQLLHINCQGRWIRILNRFGSKR